ncbi:MAG: hypothetical protein AABX94_04080, partial [Nanoarchaeota archaeon]
GRGPFAAETRVQIPAGAFLLLNKEKQKATDGTKKSSEFFQPAGACDHWGILIIKKTYVTSKWIN